MRAMRMGPPAGLLVGWLTMFVVGTDLFVVSPLLPMISADYGVSPAVAGLSVTVFALTYMISAPLFGHVADRIGGPLGWRWSYRASCCRSHSARRSAAGPGHRSAGGRSLRPSPG